MSEYLAPGVFVEEVSFRSKSIEGVGTSVCGMVGPTRFGPVRGTPEVLTSYGEFEKIFGDSAGLVFTKDGVTQPAVVNYSALAARAFFENGGKQLYFTRVIAGGNDSDAFGAGGTAVVASATAANGLLGIAARYPGTGGNLDLVVNWLDQENLARTRSYQSFDAIPDGAEGVVSIKVPLAKDKFTGTITHPDGEFPLKEITALVKKTATGLMFLTGSSAEIVNTDETAVIKVAASVLGDGLTQAGLALLTYEFKQTWATAPTGDKLQGNTPFELVLNSTTNNLTRFINVNIGASNILRGTLNVAGTELTVVIDDGDPLTSDTKIIPLAVFSAFTSPIKSLSLQRSFSLQAVRRKKTAADPQGKPGVGETVYVSPVLSLESSADNYIAKILARAPQKKLDELTVPVVASIPPGTASANIFTALYQLFALTPAALNPTSALNAPLHVIVLGSGSDGAFPKAIDYAGEMDEQGPTGFAALENVEDVSIVATPAATADKTLTTHHSIVVELEKHCMKMRYRFGLVDSGEDWSLAEVQKFRDNFDNSRLALYSPWVVVADPLGEKETVNAPPSGFMAGIYARTDVDRGVHKAPANTPVLGALRFSQNINKFQQELLNPKHINCLRSFSGRGHQVWGGRTLSSDPEWKYVNVRRYFLYLERSVEKGTQWAVFEPNGERLWANVVTTIESFLFNEWKNGRLLGSKPSAAYFVRCDRTTMSQNDLDNGRLICEVGVAPLTPAEFVIFRIGQKTADA